MRQAGRSIVVAVFLAMAGAAVAGQLEDGQAAIKRHDYANASVFSNPWRNRVLRTKLRVEALVEVHGK